MAPDRADSLPLGPDGLPDLPSAQQLQSQDHHAPGSRPQSISKDLEAGAPYSKHSATSVGRFQPTGAPDDAAHHLRRRSSLGSAHAGHSHWLTAAGHLITAVIGAGVLGLPNSVAWLGWAVGLVALTAFFAISLWCSLMLTQVYHVRGVRHTRYKHAVLHIMGPRHAIVLSLAQHANMVLTAIGYQIAAADSMSYIAHRTCALRGDTSGCFSGQLAMTLIFGGVQLLLSQLPNLEAAWWASAIGALMSFTYSFIAIGLGASQASNKLGSVWGRPAPPMEKVFGCFSALGSVGFAYSCAIVLLEVQDTLREPPAAEKSMRKTVPLALGSTFSLYLLVSVLGYLALGNAVPDSILLGFDAAPAWVTILGNLAIVIHLAPAYQVYSQPVFATIEDGLLGCFPALDRVFSGKEWGLRLAYRSLFVGVTTVVACALPFFGAFVGLVGAATFWPTAVFYPIAMFRRVFHPTGAKARLMTVVNVVMGCVAFVATVGALETIVASASTFHPFHASS